MIAANEPLAPTQSRMFYILDGAFIGLQCREKLTRERTETSEASDPPTAKK